MKNLGIITIDKTGVITAPIIKEYNEAELYKKGGFTKQDGFKKQAEWAAKIDGTKYYISMYGKTAGKANYENKYDFPPPIDTVLFFGKCVLVGRKLLPSGEQELVSLNVLLWNKIYEKLMGGFEDLVSTAKEDEEEEDELSCIPNSEKTKSGYLKDGFVVDDSTDTDTTSVSETSDAELEEEDTEDEPEELEIIPKKTRIKKKKITNTNEVIEKNEVYVDISVELEAELFSDDET